MSNGNTAISCSQWDLCTKHVANASVCLQMSIGPNELRDDDKRGSVHGRLESPAESASSIDCSEHDSHEISELCP